MDPSQMGYSLSPETSRWPWALRSWFIVVKWENTIATLKLKEWSKYMYYLGNVTCKINQHGCTLYMAIDMCIIMKRMYEIGKAFLKS